MKCEPGYAHAGCVFILRLQSFDKVNLLMEISRLLSVQHLVAVVNHAEVTQYSDAYC